MQQQQWQKGPSQQGMMGSSAVHVWLLDGLVDKLQHVGVAEHNIGVLALINSIESGE